MHIDVAVPHAAAQSDQPAKLTRAMRRAWWLVPAFAAALLVLYFSEPQVEFDSPFLLITLNFAFSTLTSLFVVLLISRGFVLRGSAGMLLMGCGVLLWGVGSVVSIVVDPHDVNRTITIHNACAWLAASFHLAGALVSVREGRTLPASRTLLLASYATALGLLLFVCYAAVVGKTPVFFVQGKGGTPVRQYVLGTAIAMFAATAVLLRAIHRRSGSAFAYWYTLAVALIGTGLIGAMVQSSFGSPLNWTARAAMQVGGVYMFIAALVSVRDTRSWEVSLTTALSQARQRYVDLFQLAADGVIVHELSKDHLFGRIHEANPAMCTLLGYTVEELRADTAPALIAPRARAQGTQPAGSTQHCEVTLVNKQGRAIFAEVSTRLFTQHGVRLGLSLVRDVTARRQAEDQLRELAQRLTYHAENSPLAVIEWGADARLSRWSGEAERLFGWKASEVLGKSMDDFRWIHEDDQAQVHETYRDLLRGNRNFRRNRNYRKDGSIVYCEWYNSSLIDDNGQLRSILSLVLDVTARTEAEAGLRRANAELEQFAYAASHDLLEPLRNITLFGELLDRTYRPVLDDRGIEYLHYVTSGARKISDLLSGLRSYLQLSAEPYSHLRADAQTVVNDVLRTLGQTIADVHAKVDVDPLPVVAVDPVHLQQLFQNLIGNALKFRSQAPPRIHVSAQPRGAKIRFTIQDNGIGIDPRYRLQIFGVFKRLHPQAKIPGSGIGLAICQKIVERYSGSITVESTPGQGSVFIFELPPCA